MITYYAFRLECWSLQTILMYWL